VRVRTWVGTVLGLLGFLILLPSICLLAMTLTIPGHLDGGGVVLLVISLSLTVLLVGTGAKLTRHTSDQ
jgi:hypothetical protein